VGHDAGHQVAIVDARRYERTNDREIHSSPADRRCSARTRHRHRRAQRLRIRICEQRRVERREGGNGSGFKCDQRTNEQDPISKRDSRDPNDHETGRDDIGHEVDLRQRAGDADDPRRNRLRRRSVMVGLGPDRSGGDWGVRRDIHRRPTPRKVEERRFTTHPRQSRDPFGEQTNRDAVSCAGSVA
jgi:hypothetical protein